MSEDLKVINAPERIYLQIGDDFDPGEVDFSALHEVTWCADNIHGTDIAYVRAAALEAAYFRIAELESKCRLYEASLDKADKEADGLRAARIAYASEFAPDAEGLPDVGSIHANIRALMKALTEIAEQEHIELMLDPTWAQRVAAAALAQQEPK
jgi:hypothetical protein